MTLATVAQASMISLVLSNEKLFTAFQVAVHCLRYPSRKPLIIELKNSFLLTNVTIVFNLNPLLKDIIILQRKAVHQESEQEDKAYYRNKTKQGKE